MPDLWMPGVTRSDTGRRLTMRGGPALFTWHTFEAPYSYSPDLRAAVRYLATQKSDPHFVFHPITGALVQMLPATTGGRTLRAPGVNTNTHGRLHLQVEVIAYARRPWTQDLTPAGRATLAGLLAYLRSWGIPDRWAHGLRPPTYPGPGVRRIQPTQSGHFHHAGWIGNDHGDPGRIADPWAVAAPGPTPPPTTPTPPTESEELTVSEANRIIEELRKVTTVDLSEATAKLLFTGRSGPQPLSWVLNLLGNRIGRTDIRVNTLTEIARAQAAGRPLTAAQVDAMIEAEGDR